MLRKFVIAVVLCGAMLGQSGPLPQVHRLPLADCDDVVFGPDGDLYFACHSPDDRLPVEVRGAKPTPDEMDAYVLRFNPRIGKLVFATRIGGKSYDGAWRVRVDRRGHAFATGLTKSADFPTTTNALQRDLLGKSDAFLIEVGPGGEVLYSTLIGGTADELGNGLEIDSAGTVYLGGVTSSSDFKGRKHAKASVDDDAFLCRIRLTEAATSCLVFGGSQTEKLTGVALDRHGGIYAVGGTNSADFPGIHSLQKSLGGSSDLFLTRLALPSLEMTFSTTFGGSGQDSGWGIAVDRQGNPVVAGITDSFDLPGTAQSYQPVNHGRKDAFVATFELRHGRRIRTTTYFGGSSDDESGYDGGNVAVAPDGTVWLVGTTYSDDLPTRKGSQSRYGGGNGDGFVAAFDPLLRRLCFATYFGDKQRNLLEGITLSPSGSVAATGVSFAETPAASLIPFGNVFVGHHVLLLSGSRVCGQ